MITQVLNNPFVLMRTHKIDIDKEAPQVVARFKEILKIVSCDFDDEFGCIWVDKDKGEPMENLLTNIRKNQLTRFLH